MSGFAIWLTAGLVVGAAEMLAPGFFLIWIGLAACGTGALTAAFELDWHGQLAAFAALAIVLVGLAAWRLRRRPMPDLINAPTAGLIGASCYALGFQAGEGRVSLRDGTWQARVADASAPVSGEVLRVVGLDGTTLLVERPKA